MSVLDRPFFSLAVIDVALPELIESFSKVSSLSVEAKTTELAFPEQPYHAAPHHHPMVLWSPACAPELTAFMPQVSSGDYFVLEYAAKRFGNSAAAVRSTTQMVEWPINEFVAYGGKERRRIVRAMRDSPRWEFYAYGDPLPFENAAQYTSRLVRDRLQRSAVLAYLEGWGAPVRQAEFWQSRQMAFTFVRQNAA